MNKNFFSFSIILIPLFNLVFTNKIIFPFTTKQNLFEPNDEYKYIFKNEIFTTIEIGNPPQKVELFLTTRTPFFIIKKMKTFPNIIRTNLLQHINILIDQVFIILTMIFYKEVFNLVKNFF